MSHPLLSSTLHRSPTPLAHSTHLSTGRRIYSRNPYSTRPLDSSIPLLPVGSLLNKKKRSGRKFWANPSDPHISKSYGDSVIQKPTSAIRLFFQNVKGLSTSAGKEDYRYYLDCLQMLQVDIAGLAETNTCWQHPHLRDDFQTLTRKQYRQSKVVFGSPSQSVDEIPSSESFQAGGNVTLLNGGLVSRVSGQDILDPSGLGRWNGVTLEGKSGQKLSILTAYRVCKGSLKSASLGSAFAREHQYFATPSQSTVNPRRFFIQDIQSAIQTLQDQGHSVILMLDANSTLESDNQFQEFISACDLYDLHSTDPAMSTFIGSADRRIDFIFGSRMVIQHLLRSGTLSYHEGPQSDHRSLFVDLNLDFLQVPAETVGPNRSRSLHTGNPESVITYNAALLKYYSEHRMVERIDELYANYKDMPTRETVRTLLTKWDNDQGRAMEMSERQLSTPPKKCKWSPVLRNLAKIRLYWKLRLREVGKHADYSQTFQRWQSQIQQHDPSFEFPSVMETLSAEHIRIEFNKASEAFRRCQKASTPMRMKCYEDLLEHYMDDSNPNTIAESRRKAKIVRNTIEGEVIRTKFRDIRRVVKPTAMSSISRVLIPRLSNPDERNPPEDAYSLLQSRDPDDVIWETIAERDQIERHLLEYNKASFRAASESPCGHGVIQDALTFSSLSPTSINLLEGETPHEWQIDNEILKAFLASFATPDIVKQTGEIPTEITAEDVQYGFKHWRETTTTSPSGRHLGHYRSLIQHPVLLECFVKFMNIAIQSGIAIPRWSRAINVIIEKDIG